MSGSKARQAQWRVRRACLSGGTCEPVVQLWTTLEDGEVWELSFPPDSAITLGRHMIEVANEIVGEEVKH